MPTPTSTSCPSSIPPISNKANDGIPFIRIIPATTTDPATEPISLTSDPHETIQESKKIQDIPTNNRPRPTPAPKHDDVATPSPKMAPVRKVTPPATSLPASQDMKMNLGRFGFGSRRLDPNASASHICFIGVLCFLSLYLIAELWVKTFHQLTRKTYAPDISSLTFPFLFLSFLALFCLLSVLLGALLIVPGPDIQQLSSSQTPSQQSVEDTDKRCTCPSSHPDKLYQGAILGQLYTQSIETILERTIAAVLTFTEKIHHADVELTHNVMQDNDRLRVDATVRESHFVDEKKRWADTIDKCGDQNIDVGHACKAQAKSLRDEVRTY